MTIIEALKKSNMLRRKGKASHVGSHGDGWVHVELLLPKAPWGVEDAFVNLTLTRDDLLADDWEAREAKYQKGLK